MQDQGCLAACGYRLLHLHLPQGLGACPIFPGDARVQGRSFGKEQQPWSWMGSRDGLEANHHPSTRPTTTLLELKENGIQDLKHQQDLPSQQDRLLQAQPEPRVIAAARRAWRGLRAALGWKECGACGQVRLER